jgi:hypothetical protein
MVVRDGSPGTVPRTRAGRWVVAQTPPAVRRRGVQAHRLFHPDRVEVAVERRPPGRPEVQCVTYSGLLPGAGVPEGVR